MGVAVGAGPESDEAVLRSAYSCRGGLPGPDVWNRFQGDDDPGMSIAARFQEALLAAWEPGLSGPELLPERLARAAARMLPVDGAGLSLVAPGAERIPLGGS